jgi:hypothetical protein
LASHAQHIKRWHDDGNGSSHSTPR